MKSEVLRDARASWVRSGTPVRSRLGGENQPYCRRTKVSKIVAVGIKCKFRFLDGNNGITMNSTPAGTAASNGLQIQIHSPSSGATANTGDHRQGSRMILEGYLRMRGRHAHENPLEAAKEAIQNENPRQWMKTWTVLTKEAFTWGSADAAGEQEEEDEARDEEAIGYLSSGLSNRGSISCSIVRRVLEEKDHRMFILVCNVGSLIVQVR